MDRTRAAHEPVDSHEPEPIHSAHQAHLSVVDHLFFPAWVATMAGFLLWLVTLGVNV